MFAFAFAIGLAPPILFRLAAHCRRCRVLDLACNLLWAFVAPVQEHDGAATAVLDMGVKPELSHSKRIAGSAPQRRVRDAAGVVRYGRGGLSRY